MRKRRCFECAQLSPQPDKNMKTYWQSVTLSFCIGAGTLFLTSSNRSHSSNRAASVRTHPYHLQPPPLSVSDPLDPGQFKHNNEAYVSYVLAHELKPFLYQIPCYCPCDKKLGHESLLDCYRSRHAEYCPVCQKELLFCYLSHKSGRKAVEIRGDLARGDAWGLDIQSYVGVLLRRINPIRQEWPGPPHP